MTEPDSTDGIRQALPDDVAEALREEELEQAYERAIGRIHEAMPDSPRVEVVEEYVELLRRRPRAVPSESVVALVKELLNDDHFNTLERWVLDAGVSYPPYHSCEWSEIEPGAAKAAGS